MISKMRDFFHIPDSRKRKLDSNIVDIGPPPKLIRKVFQNPPIEDGQPRTNSMRKKTFFGSMGSLITKLITSSVPCEPIDCEEYSDGEDVIVVHKFHKKDITEFQQHRQQQQITNYLQARMDPANNRMGNTKPLPVLLHKNKFARLPDLHKYNKPTPALKPVRPLRLNGYQCENDISGRSSLGNASSSSFKPLPGHNISNSLAGKFSRFSNLFTSSGSNGSKSTVNSYKPQQIDPESKLRYEKLLRSVTTEYVQKPAVPALMPASFRTSGVQDYVVSGRSPVTTAVTKSTVDDEFYKKQEYTRLLFSDTSIKSEPKTKPVNSVRIKIDSKPCCDVSFTETLEQKHLGKTRQLREDISKLVEKTQKLNEVRLHCTNQYENRANSWQTQDTIILDEDEEEEYDDFPQFDDDQKQTIRQAMTGSPGTILITKFNIQITRSHIQTLQWEPLCWLNDEVINFYMNLLIERGELRAEEGYPKVYAMNTFFTQRLCSGGHSAVKRWTKKVDLFAVDIIPVPVHVGNIHWCMAIINMKEKSIKYYDSMGAKNQQVLSALLEYLREESLDKRKIELDMSDWTTENVTGNPHQENGSDCGVFSCMTAEFICRNRPIVFSQQHMNYFRQRMVLEICMGKLML